MGNPGKRYAGSRHNIGFDVVLQFGAQQGFPPEKKKFNALYTESSLEIGGVIEKVCLVRPQTFMNLSGNAVRSLLGYFLRNIEDDLNDRLLVVYDDMDLPEGRLRFRCSGTSGGHKGLQSVLNHVGHDLFSRLKIGVGRGPGVEAKDYVLEKVSGKSLEALNQAAEHSLETLAVWLQDGVESCMNRFNQTED